MLETRLAKHRMKCNALKRAEATKEPFYRDDANGGSGDEQEQNVERLLSAWPQAEVEAMCKRVRTAGMEHVASITVELLYDEDITLACENHLAKDGEKLADSKFGRKHGSQVVAIARLGT